MLVPSIFDDSFVDDLFGMPFGMNRRWGQSPSLMNVDIQENENGYQLDLELPGFKKEEIQAELKDGYLYINAVHSENNDQKDENGKYIRRERYSGKCQRSFYVGENVTQDDIKASFENGILKLNIPKVEDKPVAEEKKYIAIEG